MTCSTCVNWNPRESGAMAKHHMAVCNLGPKWQYMPPTGKCNEHRAAPADVVSKRVEWLSKDKA